MIRRKYYIFIFNSTYNDNILSGSVATGDVIFNDSSFNTITCLGSATAQTVTTGSDYRLKLNVTNLHETHTVDKLNPVQYNNTLTQKHEYGLIAHELQEVYPDFVRGKKDGDGYQSVQYNSLIGVLVKEVQELKQRLDTLDNTK